AVGGAYAGSTAARAIATHLAKSGSDRAHEEVRMRTSGMTEQEIKEAEELARATSAKYKSISTTEIMHTARNIRAVVG
ncbi:NH3-dependent NAD+ synthetase, partial [Sporomusaceae bacterium BoRhaA]